MSHQALQHENWYPGTKPNPTKYLWETFTKWYQQCSEKKGELLAILYLGKIMKSFKDIMSRNKSQRSQNVGFVPFRQIGYINCHNRISVKC